MKVQMFLLMIERNDKKKTKKKNKRDKEKEEWIDGKKNMKIQRFFVND